MAKDSSAASSGTLIAFCHIEKAAGTSLTHILRRIFFLRYAAVRPFQKDSGHFFSNRDLRIIKRCNPLLRAIGGHSVAPHGDLIQGSSPTKFITQVREPVARAASQYHFWVERMNKQPDPEAFLQHGASRNFQVRKIAGTEDLDLAKEKIRKHFLLAGTVHRFDEFLVLLADKLAMPLTKFTYRKRNISTAASRPELPDDFLDRLKERNQLDQQLYDWIEFELLAEYVESYSGDFAADLGRFKALQHSARKPVVGPLIDSIYRNAYIKPATGSIRLWNGLPYRGSYAHTSPNRRGSNRNV